MNKKTLTHEIVTRIETEVIALLLAERDSYYSNNSFDGTPIPPGFALGRNCYGYHAEAFGMMRTMVALGYCFLGADNTPRFRENAKWWFRKLEERALAEEKRLGLQAARDYYHAELRRLEAEQPKPWSFVQE